MDIKVGDTVKVLAHRNALDEEIKDKFCPFKVGETFVVGRCEDEVESGYPCPIVFPIGEFYLWRVDDLELVPSKVERIHAYRDELEIGLQDAKQMVEREDLLADIAAANSFTAVRAILRQMVGRA